MTPRSRFVLAYQRSPRVVIGATALEGMGPERVAVKLHLSCRRIEPHEHLGGQDHGEIVEVLLVDGHVRVMAESATASPMGDALRLVLLPVVEADAAGFLNDL